MGIQGSTLMRIKSWLTSRSQNVIIDGVCSKSVDVTSGVPQGTVPGPLIFLLFINDMQDDLECTLRLFADDALLYHKITAHHDDTLALQRDLDKLGLWADRWQMFNPSKCYKMSVFRSRSPVVFFTTKPWKLSSSILIWVFCCPVICGGILMWIRLLKRGTLHLHLLKGICLPALKKPNVEHIV